MPLSTFPYLELISAGWFGTIFIGFGVLYMMYPSRALSFFELLYPASTTTLKEGNLKTAPPDGKKITDCLLAVIGLWDVYIGVVVYLAAFRSSRNVLGWIVLAAGLVATGDGAVCYSMVGKGHWNHWGYARMIVGLGAVMIGIVDWLLVA